MKHIVDIDVFDPLFKVDSIGVFGIGKSLADSEEDHSWSRIKSIEEFEELTADYVNKHFGDLQDTAYQRGLEDGKEYGLEESDMREAVSYQRGLEDGKAVNDKGCEGCRYGGTPQGDSPCFNCSNYYTNNWTAKQTDDEIKVGDEVADKDGDKTIVTNIHGDLFDGLCSDGSTMTDLFLDDNRKTGRHFDIASILEDMRND